MVQVQEHKYKGSGAQIVAEIQGSAAAQIHKKQGSG